MSAETLERPAATSTGERAAGALEHPENNHAGERETKPATTKSIEADLKRMLQTGEEKPEPKEEDEPHSEGEQAEQQQQEISEKPEEQAEQAEAETAEEAEGTEEERKEWPDSFRKRIDKLTAQKGELKSEVETHKGRIAELEAENTQLKNSPQAQMPAPETPLGFIKDARHLSDYTQTVKGHMRGIEDYLDGALEGEALDKFTAWAKTQGAVDAEGGINSAKLKQIKRLAQDTLTDYVPQRLQFFQEEAKHNTTAEKRWPWLTDKNSAEFKKFEGVVRAMPGLKALPHWKAAAAIYVRGLMLEEADNQAKPGPNGKNGKAPSGAATAKGPNKAPVKTPGQATSVPQRPASNGEGKVQALREKANRTRDPKDFEALVKAQLMENMGTN